MFLFFLWGCNVFDSRVLKHLAAATQGLISLTLLDKTTQYVSGMFTGATLTSLWPPAPQSHCSFPGGRCHTCRPPAASAWCSGSSSTESPASPSPSSLDSPTQSNSWSLWAQQHPSTDKRLKASLPCSTLLLLCGYSRLSLWEHRNKTWGRSSFYLFSPQIRDEGWRFTWHGTVEKWRRHDPACCTVSHLSYAKPWRQTGDRDALRGEVDYSWHVIKNVCQEMGHTGEPGDMVLTNWVPWVWK